MGKLNDLLKLPLKKHQIYGVKFALTSQWSINSFAMGHGKSAIAVAISLFTKSKTLVICPAFLKLNWRNEYTKFPKRDLKIKVLSSKDMDSFKPSDEDVIIINYAILSKTEKLFEWANFICCDESHYLGSPASQRTKSVYKYAMKYLPERLLLLSGTPIRGKVAQYYVPIKLTGNNPKGTSGRKVFDTYTQFRDTYCLSRMMDVGPVMIKKYYGVKNEKGLRNLLKNKFLRKCPDFELDLPPITFEDVYVDYKIAEGELKELHESYLENGVMSDHLSSSKKSNALSKVPFTFKFVENIVKSGEGPVACYSDHPQVLEDLAVLLKKKKITYTIIHGGTDVELRQKYVDDFQDGKIDVFLATIGSSSTGITITRTNKFIFNDKNWTNTENEQAYSRIYRISQTKACLIYSILSGKVDKQIQKTNEEKIIVMKKTVDFV